MDSPERQPEAIYAEALFAQLSPSEQIKILDLLKSLLSER